MKIVFRILFNVEPFRVFKVSLMESGKGAGKTYFLRATDEDGTQFDSIRFARPSEAQRTHVEFLAYVRDSQL